MPSPKPTPQTSKRGRHASGTSWGKIFCLVDAPSADAANTVHREAHGLVADDVFEVQEGL